MSGLDEKAVEAIAEFLKLRDESVMPDEADDDERIDSAKAILEALSAVGQKAGTVGVKADGDLMDQAVAFAEMWGTEQNWPHVRDAYVTAIMRERATGNGTSDRVSALTNGCNALLGLIHLVCVRDDMPAAIRDVLTTNHRIDEARAGLSISPHGDPICRKCATQEHGSYVPEECTCGDYPPPDPSGLEALSEKSIQTSDINGTMSFAIKPLEWRDHRGHTFPDTWTAKTPCGVYEIEERSASDSPAYITTGPLHVFVSDRDSLEDAKAAAQADYEARILSALIPAPSVAEAAEPGEFVAFQSEINPDVWYVGNERVAFLRTEVGVGNASDIAKRAAAGLNATHPAPSPVPSGLEALVEPGTAPQRYWPWDRFAEYEARIAALIAERDEALLTIARLNGREEYQTLMAINNDLLARAETAERALSAALNRIAEIEGETIAADLAYSALDLADRIIERATGMDAPKEWNDAYRAVAKARQKASRARSSATKQEKAQ